MPLPDARDEHPAGAAPAPPSMGGVVDPVRLRAHQALLAPGTALREGLERIVHGRTGALIVIGDTPELDQIATGGFRLDTDFTPTALRELCKLDGGLVVTADLNTIVAAGVHFVPDGSLPTLETGTRHRTADRVSRQTGLPVVTVSASMSTIALFLDGQRFPIEKPEQILARANQALAALASYRSRLVEQTQNLTALEIGDQVTVRDVAQVAQRIEMMRRLSTELNGYVTALGAEGRLLQLQLMEQTLGLDDLADLIAEDYRPDGDGPFGWAGLTALPTDALIELTDVARMFGFTEHTALDAQITPRGYRQVAAIPRLSATLGRRLINHFGSLQALFGATVSELLEVEGIGEQRARVIREALMRQAENALVDD